MKPGKRYLATERPASCLAADRPASGVERRLPSRSPARHRRAVGVSRYFASLQGKDGLPELTRQRSSASEGVVVGNDPGVSPGNWATQPATDRQMLHQETVRTQAHHLGTHA